MTLISGLHTYPTLSVADGTEVQADFANIAGVVNGHLDSTNIADYAVTTAKINTAAVDSNKLGTAAVRESHIEYTSANSGVLVPRVPGYLGANGGTLAVVSYTFTRGGTNFEELTIGLTTAANFSPVAAPAFTAVPKPCGGPFIVSADDADIIVGYGISALSASSMSLDLALNGNSTNEVTVSMLLWGPE